MRGRVAYDHGDDHQRSSREPSRPVGGINPLGVSLWVMISRRLVALPGHHGFSPYQTVCSLSGSQTGILDTTEGATMVQTRGEERGGTARPAWPFALATPQLV